MPRTPRTLNASAPTPRAFGVSVNSYHHRRNWYINYGLLERYVRANGSLPKSTTTYEHITLGRWCRRQRTLYEKGTLPQEYENALNQIPGWEWGSPYNSTWKANYELLLQYVSEYGRIPRNSDKYNGAHLGRWCSNMRVAKREGHRTVTAERVRALEEVPGWTWGWSQESAWEEKFNLLQEFVAEYKRIPEPAAKYKNTDLGLWCKRQRQRLKQQKPPHKLSTEQVLWLETIPGWEW